MPTVVSQGIEIYFEESGSGVPIVLGHSFLCSGEMWAPQVQELSRVARAINLDARGHGRSGRVDRPFSLYDMVEDVVAVLDHLQIERAIWAGLSIGGMVALRAALTVPDRVSGLLLLDTHAGPETRAKRLKYGALGLGARAFGTRPFLPAILPLMFGETTLTRRRELAAEWGERFARVHVPSILRGLGALVSRDDLVPRLGEIDVPTLVLVGSEDRSLPPRYSREIAEGIVGAQFAEVPKAGHLATLERPDAINALLSGFLQEIGSPRRS